MASRRRRPRCAPAAPAQPRMENVHARFLNRTLLEIRDSRKRARIVSLSEIRIARLGKRAERNSEREAVRLIGQWFMVPF